MFVMYQESYPVAEFLKHRALLDPYNVLSNKLINTLF
jgi:hypothetical protein